jgi:transposase
MHLVGGVKLWQASRMTQAESKSDRPSFTPEERAEWVSRYRSSGQTQAHFAQQHGLKLTTLQWWIYGPQRKQQHSTAAFREIAVSPPWSGGVWAAEVTWPSGMTVRLGASSRGLLDRSFVEGGAPRMLSFSPATRIFVALEPVDLRQSFNGLSARVRSVLAQDPLSGHLFLFTNRSPNRLKVHLFDGSGLWVCAKRLEKGTFGWPQGKAPAAVCGRKS